MIFSKQFKMFSRNREMSLGRNTRFERIEEFLHTRQKVLTKKIKVAIGAGLILSALLPPSLLQAQSQIECELREGSSAMWVTADCVDPEYSQPVIDSREDVISPVPHHKVSGHFEGTDKKFNFYFPPKREWDGRFFHLVYPLDDENARDVTISFHSDSGAYTVQTNANGGYRVDAAAAKFSKIIAADYYGSSDQIYGYVYGGSGGSFQTIGAIENTSGVWDGAVPYITGVPTAIPNTFFTRAFARFVLEDKAPLIADAVSPGGSGDPYADLNEVEREVLLEVTKMGVPLRGWEDYEYLLGLQDPQGLLGFGSTIRSMDPTYVDDFWSKPGYLGTEQTKLGELYREAKVDHKATITEVNRNEQNEPTSLVLDVVPADLTKTGIDYTLYEKDGTTKVGTLSGSLDPTTNVFTIGSGNTASVISAINDGDKLRIDNRWSLALTSYHRHQVPKREGFYSWDQFRATGGTPLYPQRAFEVGPLIARSVSGGGTHTGFIQGKVIMVGNLLDVDAYPWHSDWYSERVRESLGERYDDNFRVWFNDNADHIDYGARTHRLVQYDGIYQQALLDLSAWTEEGVEPAQSTQYKLVNSQIKLSKKVEKRYGVQPTVDLSVNGDDRIDIEAGQTVTFKAKVQVPPGAGRVVNTEWDFIGDGNYNAVPFGDPNQTVEVSETYTYNTPGTYFPSIRVASHHEGDTLSPFARVQNLDRVRVVVHTKTNNGGRIDLPKEQYPNNNRWRGNR